MNATTSTKLPTAIIPRCCADDIDDATDEPTATDDDEVKFEVHDDATVTLR
jgi:hypothetical protein